MNIYNKKVEGNKENESMNIQDCQQIPLEKERQACIKEVKEQTHRRELDSDEDGVSDGKARIHSTLTPTEMA